jgi:acyl-coenzyme A thioesterase PaaI-like protein
MTDISPDRLHIAGRFGVTARLSDEALVLDLLPRPEVLHHGVVRLSVLSFLVDAVAGIVIDDDPDGWALTSDMSVRMRPVPAPERIEAVATLLRRGRRSAASKVELLTGEGEPVATGAIGFTTLPRREGDPPKPNVDADHALSIFRGRGTLARPLREEAGIERLDPANGEVQVAVTPELRNPAGTLQGAIVALVAEAAAEDLVSTRFESPVVVTDLDLRYLAQAQVGPVRSRCRLLGAGPDSPVEVELVDTSVDRVTTHVYARTTAVTP